MQEDSDNDDNAPHPVCSTCDGLLAGMVVLLGVSGPNDERAHSTASNDGGWRRSCCYGNGWRASFPNQSQRVTGSGPGRDTGTLAHNVDPLAGTRSVKATSGLYTLYFIHALLLVTAGLSLLSWGRRPASVLRTAFHFFPLGESYELSQKRKQLTKQFLVRYEMYMKSKRTLICLPVKLKVNL